MRGRKKRTMKTATRYTPCALSVHCPHGISVQMYNSTIMARDGEMKNPAEAKTTTTRHRSRHEHLKHCCSTAVVETLRIEDMPCALSVRCPHHIYVQMYSSTIMATDGEMKNPEEAKRCSRHSSRPRQGLVLGMST